MMTKTQKQQIINEVTQTFRVKQWFNGAGFADDKLIVAYNFFPAFELKDVKEALHKYSIEYELKDIRVVLPGSQKDDVPSHVRQ